MQSPQHLASRRSSDVLNSACFCLSLDGEAMARALDLESGQSGLSALIRERCPFLFAAVPVFVAAPQLLKMAQVMQAVESVVALPAYREQVLATAPAITRLGTGGPLSVFFGYDFHLNQGQLGLIEVNTNAGGAMLNALLARAQRACCTAIDSMVPTLANVVAFEQRIVDMFRREWGLSSLSGSAEHPRRLTSIAIVDVRRKNITSIPTSCCSNNCLSATAFARSSLIRAHWSGATECFGMAIGPSIWSTTA